MRLWMILLLALGLAGGVNWWSKRVPSDHAAVTAGSVVSSDGFISVEMPGNTPPNTVLVLAPANCPSEQAQRAEALIQALQDQGIRVARGNSIDFNIANPSAEQRAAVDRTVEVFKQGAPAVFINGMGMSNPSLAQVAAVYEKTRQ
ncbi:hypothetical protein [Stenotrophomonas sp. Iso1]|uniref:hypothetical protein n=1 Tax=Stenotrophomonas sp. Iso1 TaxID=2977283 RepID=UPI0022B78C74|nr:hypothetical protein [Stenotrophomonas sp. Iso1]